MNASKILGLATLSLFLVNCGGQSSSRVYNGGERCEASYDPLPLEVDKPKRKVEKGDAGSFQLEPGEYTYAGAELYYQEEGGLKVHISESKAEAKTDADNEEDLYKMSRTCVRGFSSDLESFDVSALGVSEMTVNKDQTVDFKVRRYSFEWNQDNQFLKVDSSGIEDKEFDKPSKVFQEKGTQFELYETKDSKYELRFAKPMEDYTIHLAMRYDYKPFPKEEGKEPAPKDEVETPQEPTDEDQVEN